MDTQTWMRAADKGDINSVEILLAEGADVNANTANGMTALMCAASKGHTGIVQNLLDKGADVNTKRYDGLTALTLAAFFGHAGSVSALLAKGADVYAKDNHGSTALDWALSRGHAHIAQLLKEAESAGIGGAAKDRAAEPIIMEREAREQVNEPLESLGAEPEESEVTLQSIIPKVSLGEDRADVSLNPAMKSGNGRVDTRADAKNDEKVSGQADEFFYRRYWHKKSSRKSLWRVALIGAAVLMLFVSGASVYTLIEDAKNASKESQNVPFADIYSGQPEAIIAPPSSGQIKQDVQPSTTYTIPVDIPQTNLASPRGLTLGKNAKPSIAPQISPRSTNIQSNDEPVVITLAQQDNTKRVPREEEPKSLPVGKKNNERQDATAPQAVRSQDAVTNQPQSPPTPPSSASTSPRKKVIQWP